MVIKHYGPGPHKGTGTEQTIHAGGAPDQAPATPSYPKKVARLVRTLEEWGWTVEVTVGEPLDVGRPVWTGDTLTDKPNPLRTYQIMAQNGETHPYLRTTLQAFFHIYDRMPNRGTFAGGYLYRLTGDKQFVPGLEGERHLLSAAESSARLEVFEQHRLARRAEPEADIDQSPEIYGTVYDYYEADDIAGGPRIDALIRYPDGTIKRNIPGWTREVKEGKLTGQVRCLACGKMVSERGRDNHTRAHIKADYKAMSAEDRERAAEAAEQAYRAKGWAEAEQDEADQAPPDEATIGTSLPDLPADHYWVDADRLRELEGTVSKLNKRGQRHNLAPFTVTETGRRFAVLYDADDPASGGQVYHEVHLQGTPPAIPGYTTVGILEHFTNAEADGNPDPKTGKGYVTVARQLGDTPMPDFTGALPACDECHRRVHRTRTFIIKRLADGKFLQLGSECVNLYTNAKTASDLVEWANLHGRFESGLEQYWESGGRYTSGARTEWIMGNLAALIRQRGYISRAKAEEKGPFGMSTADTYRSMDRKDFRPGGKFEPTGEDLERAERVIEWASNLGLQDWEQRRYLEFPVPEDEGGAFRDERGMIPTAIYREDHYGTSGVQQTRGRVQPIAHSPDKEEEARINELIAKVYGNPVDDPANDPEPLTRAERQEVEEFNRAINDEGYWANLERLFSLGIIPDRAIGLAASAFGAMDRYETTIARRAEAKARRISGQQAAAVSEWFPLTPDTYKGQPKLDKEGKQQWKRVRGLEVIVDAVLAPKEVNFGYQPTLQYRYWLKTPQGHLFWATTSKRLEVPTRPGTVGDQYGDVREVRAGERIRISFSAKPGVSTDRYGGQWTRDDGYKVTSINRIDLEELIESDEQPEASR